MTSRILLGDCRLRLAELPDASVDSVVCDPPYHLTATGGGANAVNKANRGQTSSPFAAKTGFMGQTWDGGDVAFQPDTWAEVLRVLKPGGHLVAFSGTRTYHRMAVAIEDAGFEIRDQLAWVYGSGFPKSLDVSKQIDKAAGAERGAGKTGGDGPFANTGRCGECGKPYFSGAPCQCPRLDRAAITDSAREWQGWGTALKPSWEPICLARKPLIGTVAANVLAHGTGALNIDGCRIEGIDPANAKRLGQQYSESESGTFGQVKAAIVGGNLAGRWPANLCHDGSEEVLAGLPETQSNGGGTSSTAIWNNAENKRDIAPGDSGSAARFFYCAKSSSEERGEGNNHPTVKPVALMRWLCRLVTPKGGTVLDPFMGSGSTLLAAEAEQFNAIGCEMSPEYAAIAEKRIRDAAGMFADVTIDRGLEEAA